jgi:hypothetical protein
LPGKPVRAVLGADEEQRPSRPAGDLRRDGHLVLGGQNQYLVLGRSGIRRGAHRVQGGIMDVGRNQPADAAVEGRGEEHPLAGRRRLVEDAGDRGHEAQVGHVIRLVEHGDLDAGERAGLPLEQVDETAWCRHHDAAWRTRVTCPLIGTPP